jgi:hypothetical protein
MGTCTNCGHTGPERTVHYTPDHRICGEHR